jgi:radical SAM protein with 4Fe4S-binding SPASM domain
MRQDHPVKFHRDVATVRFMMQWHITNRCNLRCAHCYQNGYTKDDLSLPDLKYTIDQFLSFLDGKRAELEPSLRGYVVVTGGEPFVRDDLFSILKMLATHDDYFTYSILTNGTLIKETMVDCLAELSPSYVQISLDGKQQTHDRLRGPGAFQKSVSAINLLAKRGIRTIVSFTASRENFREFPDVAKIAAENGASRIWADRVIPNGAGASLSGKVLTPEETRELFELMAATRKEFSNRDGASFEIAMHRALQFIVGKGRPYRCTAGNTLFAMLPNGDLVPCRRMPIHAGNLLVSHLKTLYDEKLFTSLRSTDLSREECSGCQHVSSCDGGLKCLSYALNGNLRGADPGCWLAWP